MLCSSLLGRRELIAQLAIVCTVEIIREGLLEIFYYPVITFNIYHKKVIRVSDHSSCKMWLQFISFLYLAEFTCLLYSVCKVYSRL